MAALAVQPSIGLTRLLLLTVGGTWLTNSILLKDGRWEELLDLLKFPTESKEKDSESEMIRQLVNEIKRLHDKRDVVVISDDANATKLLPAVAALSAVGYGYMRWKGLLFSDLMYVTKRSMANAVSNMTAQLDKVSVALAAAKRHLTQRIENLDGKLDEQKEMSKLIKNEVDKVHTDISKIDDELDQLEKLVLGLDYKMCTLLKKQDCTNAGVRYLCNLGGAKDEIMDKFMQNLPEPASKTRRLLEFEEAPSLKGLKGIADSIMTKQAGPPMTDACIGNGDAKLEASAIKLTRIISIKC